jgi:putative ABC transport system permease protein
VTLFTVFAASLKASIDRSIDRSFAGDVVVSSGPFGGAISPALAGDVAARSEVDLAVGVGRGAVQIDGDTKEIAVSDLGALDQVLEVDLTGGSLADVGDRGLAVSKGSADANGWAVGDRLPVTFADGATEELTIGAIYDGADMLGGYLLPRSVWTPHAVQDVDSLVLVGKAPGVSVAEAEAAVTEVAAGYGSPDVADRDEFAANTAGNVDVMLTIIYALLALAIVIALMGIANTMSLSIHERTRELGLLRAVGQTRRQVRAMVRGESVLIAGFGAVGGIALGVFLGWALVAVLGAGNGVMEVFALPTARLVIVLVVGALAGVVAGLRPARRASRMDVLAAIATE